MPMKSTKISTLKQTFADQTALTSAVRLRDMQAKLPPCVRDFLDGIADTATVRTRLAYAYDLKIFFRWASDALDAFRGLDTHTIEPSHIDLITARDLEHFQQYLTLYSRTGDDPESSTVLAPRSNAAPGKMRKMSALRSFFKYLFIHNYISANRASLIPLPKLREKPIVHLEPDETAKLLNLAESGASLTSRQLSYHGALSARDGAILTLLLGTGIRVSECVGLNLEDLNFQENAFRVTRKGGDQAILYFSDEVASALQKYIAERKDINTLEGHERALFLSLQRRRITQRAVQNLTKKYAQAAAPLKRVSPHKLRSTYGTQLYRESGDIYLVADVLGHSDVNTTRRHYAAMNEERRRSAAQMVKLREDEKKDQ
ncbi:MAG: tyrosine-type recombinase/integrase [Oscillospiraceae bacterium]|jgi:site-specific recombinase XerD|nr:tyrosine-type recombinase/integrase [Oscillospiraceae bacterium]